MESLNIFRINGINIVNDDIKSIESKDLLAEFKGQLISAEETQLMVPFHLSNEKFISLVLSKDGNAKFFKR